MGKYNTKIVVIGEGEPCPKCSLLMERRGHNKEKHRLKTNQLYYFTEWDYCKKCGHLQHYDKFRKTTRKGMNYEEYERQNQFLKSI